MSRHIKDYDKVVQDLLSDPDSYDNWSDSREEEESEIRTLITDSIWGGEE